MVHPASGLGSRCSPIGLSEHFVLLKFNVVSHDEKGGPGQLMSQSIMRYSSIGLSELSIIKNTAWTMGLSGVISCLRERPRQITIPVFGVAFAFLLFIAGPTTIHLPAIGNITAYLFKPFNRSRFEQDRPRHDHSYARKGEKLGKGF